MASHILSSENPNEDYSNLKKNIFQFNDPIKYFEDVISNSSILGGLKSLKFYSPLKLQKEMLPALLDNFDNSIFFCAPLQSGKTTVLLLYIMKKLSSSKGNNFPRILMLCPTCEITKKTYELAEHLCGSKGCNFSLSLIIKGVKKKNVRPADLIIGTPEKIKQLGYDSLDLTKLEILVIDEADSTISSHSSSIRYIISKLNRSSCNFIFCSSSKIDKLEAFVGQEIFPKLIMLDFTPKESNPKNQVYFTYRDFQDKVEALRLMEKKFNGQIIVICKDSAKKLEQLKLGAHFLHGKVKESDKEEVKEQFKKGFDKILIITPSNASSDILPKDDVNMIVFNFNMSLLKESYEFNEMYYKASERILNKREKLLNGKNKNLIINVMDNKWASHFAKRIKPENIVNSEGLENYLDNFFG